MTASFDPRTAIANYCPPGVAGAANALDKYVNERAKQYRTFCGPLFDYVNLLGLADPATLVLAAGTFMTFFQTPRGQAGAGWTAAQRDYDTTNFEGANMFPAGVSFVAHAIGVDIGQIDGPRAEQIGRHLVRFGIVEQTKYSNTWHMGALRMWPSGEYGFFSPAAATTTPNSTLLFPQNGRMLCQELPEGCQLAFTALDQISFGIKVTQPITLTADGNPPNGIAFGLPGSNLLDPNRGVPLGVILPGTRFEQAAAT